MKQKHELSKSTSEEPDQVTKGQQLIVNLLCAYAQPDHEYIPNLTQEERKMYNNAASTCSSQFRLFKPNLVNQLLVCVARGSQDKVRRLFQISPELMLEKTHFTDCSGRNFSKISAFEFILWALDTRYMVNMMFNCLPQGEVGLELAQKLKEQYHHHKEHGVTYTLKGKIINEKHFDFSVLTNALHDHVDNFDKWDWPQRGEHWCKVVGMAQCYVPAHVMQHYCEPKVPFYRPPKFEAEQFVRTLTFYRYLNKLDSKEMTWAGITPAMDLVLGVDFGILRGGADVAYSMRGCGRLWETVWRESACVDLTAITSLCKVRTSDYSVISTRLDSLLDKKATNSCLI